MYIYHMCVGTHERQKTTPDLLELQLQAVGSHGMWVLRTELRSLARGENSSNNVAMSVSSFCYFPILFFLN